MSDLRLSDEELEKASLLTATELMDIEELCTIGLLPNDEDSNLEYQARNSILSRRKSARKTADAQLAKIQRIQASPERIEKVKEILHNFYVDYGFLSNPHSMKKLQEKAAHEIAALSPDVSELEAKVATLEKQLACTNMRDRQRKGESWCWLGDGDDHLDSLTCPILINAEELRGLLEQARKEVIDWVESRFGPRVPISSQYDDPGFIFTYGYEFHISEEDWQAYKKGEK